MTSIATTRSPSPLPAATPPDAGRHPGSAARPAFRRGEPDRQPAGLPLPAGPHPNMGLRGQPQPRPAPFSPPVRNAPAPNRPGSLSEMGPMTRVRNSARGVAESFGPHAGLQMVMHPTRTVVSTIAAFIYGLFRPLHR